MAICPNCKGFMENNNKFCSLKCSKEYSPTKDKNFEEVKQGSWPT